MVSSSCISIGHLVLLETPGSECLFAGYNRVTPPMLQRSSVPLIKVANAIILPMVATDYLPSWSSSIGAYATVASG